MVAAIVHPAWYCAVMRRRGGERGKSPGCGGYGVGMVGGLQRIEGRVFDSR